MKTYSDEKHINIGTGNDVTIRELAETIARIVGVESELSFDPTRPDGPPRKLLDTSRLQALGWKPRTGIETGLKDTYAWYLQQKA